MSKAGTTRLRAAAAITLLSCAGMMILAAFALARRADGANGNPVARTAGDLGRRRGAMALDRRDMHPGRNAP